jgi:hypothetical protein
MTKRLEKYARHLKALRRASHKNRKSLLRQHIKDAEFVKCLCECSKNILHGHVALTTSQKKALNKRKQALRQLASKKISMSKRRQIIQSGGFLGALLGPIISVLGGIFGGGN